MRHSITTANFGADGQKGSDRGITKSFEKSSEGSSEFKINHGNLFKTNNPSFGKIKAKPNNKGVALKIPKPAMMRSNKKPEREK